MKRISFFSLMLCMILGAACTSGGYTKTFPRSSGEKFEEQRRKLSKIPTIEK